MQTTNREELQQIATDARQHANNVAADIANASHRLEHIRLTQLALEADRLATAIENLLAASA